MGITILRCVFVFLLGCLLLPLVERCSGARGSEPAPPTDRGDNQTLSAAADWHLLQFWPRRSKKNPGRRITRIEIVFDKGYLTQDEVTIVLSDPKVLHMIERAVDLPLRIAIPDDGTCGGGFGDNHVGVMRVETAGWKRIDGRYWAFGRGEFIIGLNPHGFALNEEWGDFNHTFFSWALAKQIDELFFARTKKHLPADVFAGLSGEMMIQMQKDLWKARLSNVKPKRTKNGK